MNKLLKQINDIQSQLNALQGDLINLLPAITFAEEMFSSRGLSDEENCSDVPSKPQLKISRDGFISDIEYFIKKNGAVNGSIVESTLEYFDLKSVQEVPQSLYSEFLDIIRTCDRKAEAAKEENICVSSKLIKAKEEAETKSVTKRKKLQAKAEPAPEPAPEPATELTLQQSAEARSIADPTDEQQAEVIANTQRLIDETKELVAEKKAEKADTPSALSYDDFKNAIYTFIKENTAVNKPIVLGIFKERGYGFTSDVPEADYQLVLDLIKERG